MELTSDVTRAALLVGVEGVALAALGVGYAVAGVVGDPTDRAGTELAAVAAVASGVALLLVARGLAGRRRWARSPAVVTQLLALPVGVSLVQARIWLVAVVVLGLAGLVLYSLATPEARSAFGGLDERRPD